MKYFCATVCPMYGSRVSFSWGATAPQKGQKCPSVVTSRLQRSQMNKLVSGEVAISPRFRQKDRAPGWTRAARGREASPPGRISAQECLDAEDEGGGKGRRAEIAEEGRKQFHGGVGITHVGGRAREGEQELADAIGFVRQVGEPVVHGAPRCLETIANNAQRASERSRGHRQFRVDAGRLVRGSDGLDARVRVPARPLREVAAGEQQERAPFAGDEALEVLAVEQAALREEIVDDVGTIGGAHAAPDPDGEASRREG